MVSRQQQLADIRDRLLQLPMPTPEIEVLVDVCLVSCSILADIAAELEVTKRIAVDAGNDARCQKQGEERYGNR